MENPKENPLNVGALAGETSQGADDAAALPMRLDRYAKAHHRAVDMAHYASARGEVKLAAKLENCGSYLLFRDYYTVGKVRLHAAQFCKKHLVCPFCAIRRGAKMVKAYLDRLKVILAENPNLKPYMIGLTVKDGPDLGERFDHLQSGVQKLHRARSRERQYNESCKAAGAVWSYEFKRGANSKEWHPHIHAIWLCEEAPDKFALSEQWKAITGDSFIVDVKPFHQGEDVIGGFLEVFKYAVKFSDLPLEDNWHGFEVLAGKRLIASFGLFRGVEVPEEMTDEQLHDLPYLEHLYKFALGVGYTRIDRGSNEPKRSDGLKRPRGRAPMIAETKDYETLHLRQLRRKHKK